MTTKPRLTFTKPASFDFKRSGDHGIVEGYGAVFRNTDSYGDIIEPGAFSESLAKHRRNGRLPPMLWAHDPSRPVGRWTSMEEDHHGLRVTGELALASAAGREAYELLRAGASTGLSIGYSVPPGGRVSNPDGTTTLRKIDLWELSLVAMPANDEARVISVKLRNARELERHLRASGLSRQAAKLVTAGGWPLLAGRRGQPVELAEVVDDLVDGLKASSAPKVKDYNTAARDFEAALANVQQLLEKEPNS